MPWIHKVGFIRRLRLRSTQIPSILILHRDASSSSQGISHGEPDMTLDHPSSEASFSSMPFRPPPLPDPPDGIPRTTEFEAERLGAFSKAWLQDALPAIETAASHQSLLPQKEVLWETAPHLALEAITRWRPYHTVLQVIMTHGFFFLLEALPFCHEAPMPHVVYEDMMKALTFSSLQRPPMEHFALSSKTLRNLLGMAAYYCILDRHYFTSATLLFRRIEQQQPINAAVRSAWVYVCTAAGKIEEALAGAVHLAERGLAFDPEVFAMMQTPSLSPAAIREGAVTPHLAKGLIIRQRLCRGLSRIYNAATVALHAMFVHYTLTLQHTTKWELFSRAVGRPEGSSLSGPTGFLILPALRTLRLALQIFAQEKGVRCGPFTVKALVRCLCNEATASMAAEVTFVLLRVRQNEASKVFEGLPSTAFSEEEMHTIQTVARHRAETDESFRLAVPLVDHLLADPCWNVHPQQQSFRRSRSGISNSDVAFNIHDTLSYQDENERTDTIDQRRVALQMILSQLQLMGRTARESIEQNASGSMGNSVTSSTKESYLGSFLARLSAPSRPTADAFLGETYSPGGRPITFSMESFGSTSPDFSIMVDAAVVHKFVQTLRDLDHLSRPRNSATSLENPTASLSLERDRDLIDYPGVYRFKTQNYAISTPKKINHVLTRFSADSNQGSWTEKVMKMEIEEKRLWRHLPDAWMSVG
ncbi:unnamed protein product [Phytomonas sp. Hart1]|nr:unnamed protein product [Phytomonas sp. Hart1]|eukprot:CCW66412.1 unnamed protein product [Phytomonas sp. isolate Hart1]